MLIENLSLKKNSLLRQYLSLILLVIPAFLFALLLFIYRHNPKIAIGESFPYLPFQFILVAIFGTVATVGGVLDWKFHRNPLNMKIPEKERLAEAAALGLGGLPMFVLMFCAMLGDRPTIFLMPILIVLVYTTTAISYDEFIFHKKRCGNIETHYHRMLVFGNGIAWFAWFHYIYCK